MVVRQAKEGDSCSSRGLVKIKWRPRIDGDDGGDGGMDNEIEEEKKVMKMKK